VALAVVVVDNEVVNDDVVHGLWTWDLGPWTLEFGYWSLKFEFLSFEIMIF
jgi:hypothetical protein